jgi:hypothetical protein
VDDADITMLARNVIGQVAPEELGVFDSVAQGWASGTDQRRKGRSPGASVGFGLEALLMSQLVFPIITGALGDVLGTSITERAKPRRRAAKRAAKTGAAAGAGDVAGGQAKADSDGSGALPALSPAQFEALRTACTEHATALGLAQDKAHLLADAVVGSMMSADE